MGIEKNDPAQMSAAKRDVYTDLRDDCFMMAILREARNFAGLVCLI